MSVTHDGFPSKSLLEKLDRARAAGLKFNKIAEECGFNKNFISAMRSVPTAQKSRDKVEAHIDKLLSDVSNSEHLPPKSEHLPPDSEHSPPDSETVAPEVAQLVSPPEPVVEPVSVQETLAARGITTAVDKVPNYLPDMPGIIDALDLVGFLSRFKDEELCLILRAARSRRLARLDIENLKAAMQNG